MLTEDRVELAQVGLHAVHTRFQAVEAGVDIRLELVESRLKPVELPVVEEHPGQDGQQGDADNEQVMHSF